MKKIICRFRYKPIQSHFVRVKNFIFLPKNPLDKTRTMVYNGRVHKMLYYLIPYGD